MPRDQTLEPITDVASRTFDSRYLAARAKRWTVSAPLPKASSSTNLVELPALALSILDDRSLGVPGVFINATVLSFSGACSEQSPQLLLASPVRTDVAGVAKLTGQLDVASCGPGDLVLKIMTRERQKGAVIRYARVVLFQASTERYTHSTSLKSVKAVDDLTDVLTVGLCPFKPGAATLKPSDAFDYARARARARSIHKSTWTPTSHTDLNVVL